MASGLDVDQVQVFVEAVRGNTRRVAFYIADEDPFLLPPRRSPLAKLPKVSVWDAAPLGTEPRGREARPSLIFNSFLIGAIPRSGKTFAGRVLCTPGLLDPYCDITVLDFKGGKDWKAVEDLAVSFRSGDSDEDLEHGVAVLAKRKHEAQQRFKAFQAMSDEENPEGKLTRELGRAGYHPHLIIIDEVQNLLRASDKRIREESLAC
jgi:S-DNA-T family DNA segregation ATPase FtsK/SpoIIIE